MTDPELIVGVDFAGPRKALAQRRKIIALGANRLGAGAYELRRDGFNGRIQNLHQPGWTAEELADVLATSIQPRVVAFDFPFSIPRALLSDPAFSAAVGRSGSFDSWEAFNEFVAAALPLECPIDLAPFSGWRTKANWLRRGTDVVAIAQPALKDRFQVLFNMTLLGNALLARLVASQRYRIVPFADDGPPNDVIEVYPGLTMRDLGRRDYKRDPVSAIDAVLAHCGHQGIEVNIAQEVKRFCQTYTSGGPRGTDPDGSDALIALATAILYREGRAVEAIKIEDRRLRSIEGVIWRPALDTMLPARSIELPSRSRALPQAL